MYGPCTINFVHDHGRPPSPRYRFQALDVDPATGLLEGDEDEEGFEEEYPLEQLNIATADFMAKVKCHPCAYMHLLLSVKHFNSMRFPPADGSSVSTAVYRMIHVCRGLCVCAFRIPRYPPHHAQARVFTPCIFVACHYRVDVYDVHQVSLGDFRRGWEQMGAEAEVLEKFALGFKRLQEAVAAVEDFLGMQTCDGTGR